MAVFRSRRLALCALLVGAVCFALSGIVGTMTHPPTYGWVNPPTAVWIGLGALAFWNLRLRCKDARRPRDGRCVACDYDLTGNVSGRCPECGSEITRVESGAAEIGGCRERHLAGQAGGAVGAAAAGERGGPAAKGGGAAGAGGEAEGEIGGCP